MTNNYSESQITFSKDEFIRFCYLSILEREPDEAGFKDWLNYLNHNDNLVQMIKMFLHCDEFFNQQLLKISQEGIESFLGESTCIIGEKIPLTPNQLLSWYHKASKQLVDENYQVKKVPNQQLNSLSNNKYTVAIINSLYKGKKYIKSFLDNMISQSIFNECQLIIIDANSPENEREIIKEYTQQFKNIEYIKCEEKIGIYQAWNLGINHSDTEFITNANVDDLHRKDALELKVKALKNNPEIDVVYSDVYYSFIPNFPFEKVAKCGIKSNLPVANKENLMLFNSPHNSPMWRRSLHEKIGYFDTQYQSAGDYEFWLRAAFSDIKFVKIPEPVTLYYNNPQGISTKKNTKSVAESSQIINFYQSLLDDNNSQLLSDYYSLIYETIKQQNQDKVELLDSELLIKQKIQDLKQQELAELETILETMQSSKFWKLHLFWLKLKTIFNPNLDDIKNLKNENIATEKKDFDEQQKRLYSNNIDTKKYLLKNTNYLDLQIQLNNLEQKINHQYLIIKHLENSINNTQIKIKIIKTEIEKIQMSKFWQIRNIWFNLKNNMNN